MLLSDAWHRRQAVAIASTLPEDTADAKIILQLTMELLDGFLSDRATIPTAPDAQVSRIQPSNA